MTLDLVRSLANAAELDRAAIATAPQPVTPEEAAKLHPGGGGSEPAPDTPSGGPA